jgi:type II secretory pathway pseudopilin PulG
MKYCPRCGKDNADEAQFCQACGAGFSAGSPTNPTAPLETSGKAIASLICGILFIFLPAAIAAVILGHISLSEIRRNAGRLTGSGMATAGLVLGYSGILVIPLLIIAAIAIPNLLRARIAANEATAVWSLRTINAAAIVYAATYGKGFPLSLSVLGPPPGGGSPSEKAANLLDAVLAEGRGSGYVFRYEASSSKSGGLVDVYAVQANPIERGSTGQRYFFTDETGVIRFEQEHEASRDSPPIR